jgi:hypothetical protein
VRRVIDCPLCLGKGTYTHDDFDKREQANILRTLGMSYRKIATIMNLKSWSTVGFYLKKYVSD